jgi:hypothetical protein
VHLELDGLSGRHGLGPREHAEMCCVEDGRDALTVGDVDGYYEWWLVEGADNRHRTRHDRRGL